MLGKDILSGVRGTLPLKVTIEMKERVEIVELQSVFIMRLCWLVLVEVINDISVS